MVALSAPALAQQAGSPEWPQFQGGPGHPGGVDDGPEPPYRIRWTLPAPGDGTLSGVAISGGVAVTVGRTAVYGVDVQSGDVVWESPRIGGPLSVPAIAAGDTTIVLFTEGPAATEGGTPTPADSPAGSSSATPSVGEEAEEPGSFLVAIDPTERTELWRVALAATSRTGVAVDGDTAYVGDDEGNVYAVAVADGSLRWGDVNVGDAGGTCVAYAGGRVDVPIAVADGRVIAVARDVEQGSVVISAFSEADGSCLWRRAPQVGSTSTSAAAAGDGIVIVGLSDRYVRGLAGESGDQHWASLALKTFWPSTSPALRSDAVYVSDLSGGLYRFDLEDGSRRWGFQFNELSFRGSPVVSGGVVLLGLDDGRLTAVDRVSGHLVWESEATLGAIGTIALSEDVVVATKGGPDAGLIAFEPDPTGTLIDVPSPTELDPAATLPRLAAAAAIALVVLLVPGLLARRRFALAIGDDAEPEDDEVGNEEDGP